MRGHHKTFFGGFRVLEKETSFASELRAEMMTIRVTGKDESGMGWLVLIPSFVCRISGDDGWVIVDDKK